MDRLIAWPAQLDQAERLHTIERLAAMADVAAPV